jgi:hypothetical protein
MSAPAALNPREPDAQWAVCFSAARDHAVHRIIACRSECGAGECLQVDALRASMGLGVSAWPR